MHGLLMTALHDPSLSQQAAIFHQRQLLQQDAVTTNAPRGTAVKTLNAKLRDSSTVCFSCLTRATLSYSAIRYDSAVCCSRMSYDAVPSEVLYEADKALEKFTAVPRECGCL